MSKVIIIGGNAAGLSAASQVKRLNPSWNVIVLEKGEHVSYAGCGIPYYIGGVIKEFNSLFSLTPEVIIKKRNIDLRLRHEVQSIDPEDKSVAVNSPSGMKKEEYDYLVIATGALPLTKGISFTPSNRVSVIRNLEDAGRIKSFLDTNKPDKVAVVGGGYIAIEILEAFRMLGLETHLLHRRNDLARVFNKDISDRIKAEMEKEGVILNLNTPVKEIVEKQGQVVVNTGGKELFYDFVVVATGVIPNTKLAGDAGIQLGAKGAIKVNQFMQTNHEDIYAAGDCVETRNLITGKQVHLPLALKANREGVVAGQNICGHKEKYPGILGTAITKFFDLGIAVTGISPEESEASGFDPAEYSFTASTKAGYYPGAEELFCQITIDKKQGHFLGAQLAGPVDSVKRIDVFAAMIQNKMKVEDAFYLDLSYAPPFSPVYDPVALAARLGKKHLQ